MKNYSNPPEPAAVGRSARWCSPPPPLPETAAAPASSVVKAPYEWPTMTTLPRFRVPTSAAQVFGSDDGGVTPPGPVDIRIVVPLAVSNGAIVPGKRLNLGGPIIGIANPPVHEDHGCPLALVQIVERDSVPDISRSGGSAKVRLREAGRRHRDEHSRDNDGRTERRLINTRI